jgi:hypothetical protein
MEAMMEMDAELIADNSELVGNSDTSVEDMDDYDIELLDGAEIPPAFPGEDTNLAGSEDTSYTESELNEVYDEAMMASMPDEMNDSVEDSQYTDSDISPDFPMDMDVIDIPEDSSNVADNPDSTGEELNEMHEETMELDFPEGNN